MITSRLRNDRAAGVGRQHSIGHGNRRGLTFFGYRNSLRRDPLKQGEASKFRSSLNLWRFTMIRTFFAAAAALTMISGIAMADDLSTTGTTHESTSIGPLKFERDHTERHDSADRMGMATRDQVQVDKQKTVTHDWDGDTTSHTRTETTTVR